MGRDPPILRRKKEHMGRIRVFFKVFAVRFAYIKREGHTHRLTAHK